MKWAKNAYDIPTMDSLVGSELLHHRFVECNADNYSQ